MLVIFTTLFSLIKINFCSTTSNIIEVRYQTFSQCFLPSTLVYAAYVLWKVLSFICSEISATVQRYYNYLSVTTLQNMQLLRFCQNDSLGFYVCSSLQNLSGPRSGGIEIVFQDTLMCFGDSEGIRWEFFQCSKTERKYFNIFKCIQRWLPHLI